MCATVMHGPGDVRFEQFDDPKIVKPTEAIIKLSATCICGYDLRPFSWVAVERRPRPYGP